jgi:hypothetical protein
MARPVDMLDAPTFAQIAAAIGGTALEVELEYKRAIYKLKKNPDLLREMIELVEQGRPYREKRADANGDTL